VPAINNKSPILDTGHELHYFKDEINADTNFRNESLMKEDEMRNSIEPGM
jgi:hypothetical protein